jgi:hypothetical protein
METRRGMESRPRGIGGEIVEHKFKKRKKKKENRKNRKNKRNRRSAKTRVNLRGVIWAY